MIQIIGPPLSQWDTGRSIEASGSTATHAHFANRGDSYAVIMELVDGKTKIPDYLLQTNKDLLIYLVLDGVTQESKTFSVRKREKPENYVYEDDQRNYIYKLIEDAQAATNAANQVAQDLLKDKENGAFNGKDGKSAYEIAVQNGFEGTEAEWLESLKGENGNGGGYEIPCFDLRKIGCPPLAVGGEPEAIDGYGRQMLDAAKNGPVKLIADVYGPDGHINEASVILNPYIENNGSFNLSGIFKYGDSYLVASVAHSIRTFISVSNIGDDIIGNISTALTELHTYAESLKGGASV